MDHLNRADEAERILRAYGDRDDAFAEIMAMLERQFTVLHNRAQVLLGLCGIIVSTTGFSGRLVAGTNLLAQWLIITGVALVLVAAAVVCWGVLHLRWLTMQGGNDTRAWLMTTLRYRDQKTLSYRVGLVFLLAGLVVYSGSVAIMLLYPHEVALPAR